MSPAISVIVPCYNLGQYLDEAIQSVLDQTIQDFEIVVVDDGSTDATTRRLLEDYSRPRTRVVRSDNQGLPAAKNLGLERSSGAYVCMLDADDRLAPTFLEKSLHALEEAPDLAFVSHWFQTFGDEVWDWTPTRCDLETLLDANTVNGAALVRRSALEAVGGFDAAMNEGCEDWDLWISLVERGFTGRILPEVLFYYRRRAGSMSRRMMEGDKHPELFRRLVEKHTESYRAHLTPLLLRRERDVSQLDQQVHAIELDYYRELEPELVRRRDDLAMLQTRAELDELSATAERATHEVTALRSSWSWRVTAPLRALLDLARKASGGKGE